MPHLPPRFTDTAAPSRYIYGTTRLGDGKIAFDDRVAMARSHRCRSVAAYQQPVRRRAERPEGCHLLNSITGAGNHF